MIDPMYDEQALEAFANRPWRELERAKHSHWARLYQRFGSEVTLAAAQALWEHARTVRPDWPSAEERAEDLAHHVALQEALSRAARAIAAG